MPTLSSCIVCLFTDAFEPNARHLSNYTNAKHFLEGPVCHAGLPQLVFTAWLVILVNEEITTIYDNLLFVSADLQPSPRDICTYAGTSVTVTRSAQEHYFQHLSNEEVCDN